MYQKMVTTITLMFFLLLMAVGLWAITTVTAETTDGVIQYVKYLQGVI